MSSEIATHIVYEICDTQASVPGGHIHSRYPSREDAEAAAASLTAEAAAVAGTPSMSQGDVTEAIEAAHPGMLAESKKSTPFGRHAAGVVAATRRKLTYRRSPRYIACSTQAEIDAAVAQTRSRAAAFRAAK